MENINKDNVIKGLQTIIEKGCLCTECYPEYSKDKNLCEHCPHVLAVENAIKLLKD